MVPIGGKTDLWHGIPVSLALTGKANFSRMVSLQTSVPRNYHIAVWTVIAWRQAYAVIWDNWLMFSECFAAIELANSGFSPWPPCWQWLAQSCPPSEPKGSIVCPEEPQLWHAGKNVPMCVKWLPCARLLGNVALPCLWLFLLALFFFLTEAHLLVDD